MIKEIMKTLDYGPAPESKAAAMEWLKAHKKFDLFIGGKWLKASGKSFASINPANGDKLAMVSQSTKLDVDKAVKAAKKALPTWQKLSCHQRAKYLYALARLVQKHSRILAVIESLDNGKTIRETRDIDIPLVARHFYHHAGWASLLEDEFHISKPNQGYEAHGVCGQIIPWNFPLLMLSWKIAPALAAGNTVVLKPAEQTPLSALYFAELCQLAGLPDGVVNIITGDGKTGAEIVTHKDINKIAFTGSTEVGRIIRKQTAGTRKALTLELGGKSPFIVFNDADLDSAVEGVVNAIWFNQGEVCCAGSRLLLDEAIADKFIKKLKRRMDKLRIGDPLDKTMDMGALVDKTQVKRIQKMLANGLKEGGEVYQAQIALPNKGCFMRPMLITGVDNACTLAREEIFGPVLVSQTFRTPKEAIALANNTRFGLAASVWSENINTALDIAANIKAGVVWVNATNRFDASVGFGGYRESGYGREGGREGMLAYLKPKQKDKGELVILKPTKAKSIKINRQTNRQADSIDRTAKMYIGGKQKRPDGAVVMPVTNPEGALIGEVGLGNRKDIRNAVEAARKQESWSTSTAHLRAQIIYYIAENLSARADEFATRIREQSGSTSAQAKREVEQSIEKLFLYAGFADKHDGLVHNPPSREIAIAMNEALGIVGIVAPQKNPLLGFISLLAPVIATGNRAVLIPSDIMPLSATDFYQVLETSDLPAGVVNIVTGKHDELKAVLAEHMQIDALWYFGKKGGVKEVEQASIYNLKQVFSHNERELDYNSLNPKVLMDKATQVKNIWVPYGA